MCKHTASLHKGMLHCRRKKIKNGFKRHLSYCSTNLVDSFHPGTLATHSYPLKAVAAYILNPASNIKNTPTLIFLLQRLQPCHYIPHRCDLRNSSVIQTWLEECWVPQSGWAGNGLQPKIRIFQSLKKKKNQMMSLWAAASNHALHRKVFIILLRNPVSFLHTLFMNLQFRQQITSLQMFTHKLSLILIKYIHWPLY